MSRSFKIILNKIYHSSLVSKEAQRLIINLDMLILEYNLGVTSSLELVEGQVCPSSLALEKIAKKTDYYYQYLEEMVFFS